MGRLEAGMGLGRLERMEEEEERKDGSEENKEENYLLNTDDLFSLICFKCSSHMQDSELL
jgi:hypothetical protein